MEGRQGVFIELGGRGDRELTLRPGFIELRGIIRSLSPTGESGRSGSIFYWYDEAVALRDALNRYLAEFAPEPGPGHVIIQEKTR